MKYKVTQSAFFGEGKNAARVHPGQIVEGPAGLDKDYSWLSPVEKPKDEESKPKK